MTTKWEYAVVVQDLSDLSYSLIGGDLISNSVTTFLASMGDAGWEMCGINPESSFFDPQTGIVHQTEGMFFFKRLADQG